MHDEPIPVTLLDATVQQPDGRGNIWGTQLEPAGRRAEHLEIFLQDELTTVRGRIEELSAQEAHLESQATLSTLTVTFTLKPAPSVVTQQAGYDPTVEVDRASARLVHVLQKLTTVAIWFGIVWLPILIALAIAGTIAVVIALGVRRVWLRDGTSAEPAA